MSAVRPLLLLWDIDGTLLQRASTEHAQALIRALNEVHGDALDFTTVRDVEAAGRCDGAIARDYLAAVGVESDVIDRCVAKVAEHTAAAYAQLCPDDLSGFVVPGIAELLAQLAADDRFRNSLVTGNFQKVARIKLAAAGIGHHFEDGQGGFGSDAEDRAALPPKARERAGGWPRERTIVIGDTPNDIACARADGVDVIAVTTGPYRREQLTGADHVADGAAELLPLLESYAA